MPSACSRRSPERIGRKQTQHGCNPLLEGTQWWYRCSLQRSQPRARGGEKKAASEKQVFRAEYCRPTAPAW